MSSAGAPISASRQAALAREAAAARAKAEAEAKEKAEAAARAAANIERDLTDREKHDFYLAARRIIDQKIRRSSDYATAWGCLELLHKLLRNVIDDPDEPKYRRFKPTQKTIAEKVLQVPGGEEYLIEAGFRRRTVEMQEHWTLSTLVHPSTPSKIGWTHLTLCERALRERMAEVQEQAQRAQAMKAEEEAIEKSRKARALDEFHHDREMRAARDQREKHRRAIREAQEQERQQQSPRAESPSPSSPASAHLADDMPGAGRKLNDDA